MLLSALITGKAFSEKDSFLLAYRESAEVTDLQQKLVGELFVKVEKLAAAYTAHMKMTAAAIAHYRLIYEFSAVSLYETSDLSFVNKIMDKTVNSAFCGGFIAIKLIKG